MARKHSTDRGGTLSGLMKPTICWDTIAKASLRHAGVLYGSVGASPLVQLLGGEGPDHEPQLTESPPAVFAIVGA